MFGWSQSSPANHSLLFLSVCHLITSTRWGTQPLLPRNISNPLVTLAMLLLHTAFIPTCKHSPTHRAHIPSLRPSSWHLPSQNHTKWISTESLTVTGRFTPAIISSLLAYYCSINHHELATPPQSAPPHPTRGLRKRRPDANRSSNPTNPTHPTDPTPQFSSKFVCSSHLDAPTRRTRAPVTGARERQNPHPTRQARSSQGLAIGGVPDLQPGWGSRSPPIRLETPRGAPNRRRIARNRPPRRRGRRPGGRIGWGKRREGRGGETRGEERGRGGAGRREGWWCLDWGRGEPTE